MEKVSYLNTSEDDVGQRIDNFLLGRLKGLPKSRVYTLLRKGEIRINRGRVKPHYRLNLHDSIRLPPMRLDNRGNEKKLLQSGQAISKRLTPDVVYQDKSLMILNKPAGLAAHGGSGLSFGLIELLKTQKFDNSEHLSLVHRIDKDTSGCIMVAKSKARLRYLHQLLRTGEINKTYFALVTGKLRKSKKITAKLRKFNLQSGERLVRVDENHGQEALTIVKPLAYFKAGFTLIEAKPITGRTHQIRVHLAHSGHAICGDEKYGQKSVNQAVKASLGLKRLFLHARGLEFKNIDDQILKIIAPLDKNLTAVLHQLGYQHDNIG